MKCKVFMLSEIEKGMKDNYQMVSSYVEYELLKQRIEKKTKLTLRLKDNFYCYQRKGERYRRMKEGYLNYWDSTGTLVETSVLVHTLRGIELNPWNSIILYDITLKILNIASLLEFNNKDIYVCIYW